MCEVTGDILESSVGDSRTPGHVEAYLEGWGWNKETMLELLTAVLSILYFVTNQFPEVLCNQLDAIVGDF